MFKIGLIGSGGISTVHMRVYELLKNEVEVVAVCDSNPGRARNLAARFNVPQIFDNHRDLLENARPDIIDICTPTSSHAGLALNSARNGCHVLVEKPMARTSAECRAMIQEADRNGIKLCVCHNNLFAPAIKRARQVIDENNLEISSCSLRLKVPSRYQQSWARDIKEGGALWEGGAHAAYVQRFLLGEISRVFAMSNKIRGSTDDNFVILLQSESGGLGSAELSFWQNEAGEFGCLIDCQNGHQIEVDVLRVI